MTLPEDFQDRLVAFLRDPVLPIVLIVVIALVLIRFARTSIHRIVKSRARSRGQRGHGAGAVRRRGHEADRHARLARQQRHPAFIVVIALAHDPGRARHRHRPRRRRPRRRRDRGRLRAQSLVRDYFNGSLILLENQFSQRRRRVGRRGHRHGRGLQPAHDDDPGPRRGRPHGPQRRDQGRLEPHPRLGPDQPGRHRRLRHRHREGDDASSTRSARRWPPIPPGDDASSRRRGSSASRRWASTGSRSRSWAWSGRPSSRPPAASSGDGSSSPSPRTASRSRGRSAWCSRRSTDRDPFAAGRHDPPRADAGGAVGRRGLSWASRVAPPIRHPARAARSGRPRRVEWPDPRD